MHELMKNIKAESMPSATQDTIENYAKITPARAENLGDVHGRLPHVTVPGAITTTVVGQSDGVIAGNITGVPPVPNLGASGTDAGFIDINSVTMQLNVPGSISTTVTGIDNGLVVGYYSSTTNTGIAHNLGFEYQLSSHDFWWLTVPGSDSTQITGINAHGEIFGTYTAGVTHSGAPAVHGFIGVENSKPTIGTFIGQQTLAAGGGFNLAHGGGSISLS